MTTQTNIKPTDAEAALFALLPEGNAAAETLRKSGLPTRRVEAWHYTDLRTMLKTIQPKAEAGSADVPKTMSALVPAVFTVPIVNGAPQLIGRTVPDGIKVAVTDTAAIAGISADNTIGLISQSLKGQALAVDVESSQTMPVTLDQWASADGLSVTTKQVTFKAGTTATLIDRYQGDETAYQTIPVTHLKVEEGADATWILVQQNSEAATHLGQINAILGKDAKLTVFVLNAGGKLVRQELVIDVEGEGADFQLRSVNLVGDSSHIDVTMKLGHNVANTTSEEVIRNVVPGNGKGIFQGQIKVAQPAQKTDAQMACNTLLLTDDADFSAKPELEIFADDVICAHGATVTDIDPRHMFYLMSRGIDERTSRNLLIKAFVDEVVEDLENEPLEDALVSIIDTWLDNNV